MGASDFFTIIWVCEARKAVMRAALNLLKPCFELNAKRFTSGFVGLKRSAKAFLGLKRSACGFLGLKRSAKAFTLAELLIALAVLGVIATFTIPKVLQSQQDERYNAIAKESAGMISQAYSVYVAEHGAQANNSLMTPAELTPYLNFVKVDTATTMDNKYTQGSVACSSTYVCLKLHNGALLMYDVSNTFDYYSTTAGLNPPFLWFVLDPDGVNSGTTNGAGKSVGFILYNTGRLETNGTCPPSYGCSSSLDPPWFRWEH